MSDAEFGKLGEGVDRRQFLKRGVALGGTIALGTFVTGCSTSPATRASRSVKTVRGREIDLDIANTRLLIGGEPGNATTVNGGIPGPVLRLKEGEDVTIRVKNNLDVSSSIHWHGLLVPSNMDGVPGLSFAGIPSGDTFTYKFPIKQSGTYWYHSHSGFQEQTGVYGAIVIDPAQPDSEPFDREYTIVLSDWTFENPHAVFRNLKRSEGYYNFQRRTVSNIGKETGGFWNRVSDRSMWARMRMDSTDLSDVTGATYTYLMNGLAPSENWRGLFRRGERVKLRFVNAGAATYFDVRIPGLEMRVVACDGQNIVPATTDEFRIAIAETYDVVVEPKEDAYTIMAEAKDRSGFARGTLAVSERGVAPVPKRRARPLLTMGDMGMNHGDMKMDTADDSAPEHSTMDHSKTDAPTTMPAQEMPMCRAQLEVMAKHSGDHHGAGNAGVAEMAMSKITDPGVGLRDAEWRVLTYADLRRREPGAIYPASDQRKEEREIVLHLTGNMERYMWSFDGEAYRPEMPPIQVKLGERVRFVLLNDTMMAHPIHIHGMFFELEVGACESNPLKHTVNVKPAERTSFTVTAPEVGRWAFHCHILYHMDAGMFRVVEVTR